MILPDFKAFPAMGRIIGVDWGARRCGLAVSSADREFVFVRPAIVMARGDNDVARRVADFATDENAVGIVVGLPLHGDGTESETTQMVRDFAQKLCVYVDLPICFIPENLTSHAAQMEMGRGRVRDLKSQLDSNAARIILENAIALMRRQQKI